MLWGVSGHVFQKRLDLVIALEPSPDLLLSTEVRKPLEVGWKENVLELLMLKTIWAGDFVTPNMEHNVAPEFENFTYFDSTAISYASTSAKFINPKPLGP